MKKKTIISHATDPYTEIKKKILYDPQEVEIINGKRCRVKSLRDVKSSRGNITRLITFENI